MATTTWTALAIGAPILALTILACAVENVEAKSFNQSCTKDDDCIPVLEIVADGDHCTQPCAAINKRDQDRYQTEFEKEAHDCKTTAPPACGTHTAACSSSKCVPIFAGAVDAGAD